MRPLSAWTARIGHGPALSVRIEDMVVELLRVTFETVDVIPADEAEPVRATVYVEDGKADNTLTAFVASLKATSNQTYRLTVRYRDVTGKPHRSVMQMGKVEHGYLSTQAWRCNQW